ncbi:MAG TPA: hypothetical protein VGK36_08980 [Candidatus Angelobacter sp.]|jgi:hypothetical protein
MTPLKVFILSTILRLGPQTEYSLWHNTKCQALLTINLACFEMEQQKLIQQVSAGTPLSSSVGWALTQKGRQLIAGKKEQEVSLGSY